ncbi:leucine--tRNA ligase [Clostridium cylindrosporum]|uniref:Leucine--tRNA ligase n=1 Tax=Clostridium cylindrosporum DSM 605 TaxID=1121307 RepID=A0A0J8DEY3_CLOCY|nr:leucine--tRNA ligase [Clostridium cylindrosporum]KMT22733.1 leucine--tRNA ligase LeuS [Clostridium cylindrosporum DSM 605]
MPYSVETDKKWQQKWDETKLYEFDKSKADKKLYCLEMFSYPSGAKLHAGHWYNYGPTDTWARFKRMQGYSVFQPMGFDAFGLPAENYAIKTGVHPHDSTMKNIETMEKQLREMGAMFNWENELVTCLPDYYKWTQWIFLKLFEAGLAYRKEAPVNWCPSCSTVLANEQVLDGECERCSSEVTKKNLTQWFFNITKYADELLEKLDELDWPDMTKKVQKNWIGRSEGAEIEFSVENLDIKFNVFTTRADTLYGVTYVVLAPESPIVDSITTPAQKDAVENYKEEAKKQSEIERMSTSKEKTGVFTGSFAIHPLTGEKVEIWISDYVLATYGTGCVMAVPAHDERDYEFATKFNLPIKRVVESAKGEETTLPYTEYGTLVNSEEFNGMTSADARVNIVKKAESINKGELKVNYRLRDWLVSRQRYWGCPIPIIHCDDCGTVPVPEEQLPVELPYNVEFTPDGESPLKKSEEFVNVVCPKCGKPAKREADTLDTFVCSSWYYLRYPDNKNSEKAFDTEWINKMLPVDKYVGGPEHAAMHLLYARFFTKALRDLGYLNFDEPFKSLVHQGIILGPDGNKMSKSKGNVISPDDYVSEYGSDVFRMYLMFGFGYSEGGPWNVDGIKAMSRFASRIERFVERYLELKSEGTTKSDIAKDEKELNLVLHTAIKGVLDDTDKFQFNTALARLMELVNALYKYDTDTEVKNVEFLGGVIKDLIKLLAPFAPHLAEELWEQIGGSYSVFNESLPEFDESALVRDTIELGVQINGKVKGKIEASSSASDEEIQKIALNDDKIKEFIADKEVKKVIVIKGRLVNIVVK